jgi:transmembrane sensor
MTPAITKEFLFEYFRGNASSIQKQLIDQWAREPKNEEFFFQCLEEWERQHPQYLVDVSRRMRAFKETMIEDIHQAQHNHLVYPLNEAPPFGRRKISRWLWAASIALGIGTTGLIFQEILLYTRFETKPGEVATYNLPDGSVATLNANSRLSVARLWKFANKREVMLLGEAQFEVTKNELAKKFIVKTGNGVDIEVVGTVFSVFNRHNRTEVLLNEGKVLLTQKTDTEAITYEMVPGDKIRVDADQTLVHESGSDLSKASLWKDYRFEFDKTSLREVGQMLLDLYNLEARFETPAIEKLTVSGSFVASNADELLESVCETNELRFSKSGQTITFYKTKQ